MFVSKIQLLKRYTYSDLKISSTCFNQTRQPPAARSSNCCNPKGQVLAFWTCRTYLLWLRSRRTLRRVNLSFFGDQWARRRRHTAEIAECIISQFFATIPSLDDCKQCAPVKSHWYWFFGDASISNTIYCRCFSYVLLLWDCCAFYSTRRIISDQTCPTVWLIYIILLYARESCWFRRVVE